MSSADPTSPPAPNHVGDDVQSPPRETVSLKRGREGSVDPASETPSVTVATKKNRLDEDPNAPDLDAAEVMSDDSSSQQPRADTGIEGRTVTEVRRKVQEMGWKEGDAADRDADAQTIARAEDDDDETAADEKETTASTPKKDDKEDESDTPSLKRKADEDAAEAEKKRKSTSPTPNDTPAKAEEPPKKPQATFGAFASTSSPFAAASSSSPFAAKASPFGAASSTSPFGAAAKSSNALDAKPAASGSATGSGSGFGSYSSGFSSFAKKPPADAAAGGPSSFGDILKEKGDEAEEDKKPHLDKQSRPTGEEDEETVYQTRAKLFIMEQEGGWKERGIGQVKLNRRRNGNGARLLMRSDGVFRVILNCSLYVGMLCLEDGKHIRTTVFEEGERRFVTMRTASPKIAQELASAIHEHTPLERGSSKGLSASPAPPSKDEEKDKE